MWVLVVTWPVGEGQNLPPGLARLLGQEPEFVLLVGSPSLSKVPCRLSRS